MPFMLSVIMLCVVIMSVVKKNDVAPYLAPRPHTHQELDLEYREEQTLQLILSRRQWRLNKKFFFNIDTWIRPEKLISPSEKK